jgi:hypothetical protein
MSLTFSTRGREKASLVEVAIESTPVAFAPSTGLNVPDGAVALAPFSAGLVRHGVYFGGHVVDRRRQEGIRRNGMGRRAPLD